MLRNDQWPADIYNSAMTKVSSNVLPTEVGTCRPQPPLKCFNQLSQYDLLYIGNSTSTIEVLYILPPLRSVWSKPCLGQDLK